MKRLTYVDEDGEVLFELKDGTIRTITGIAKERHFDFLEIIAERLANREQLCDQLYKDCQHWKTEAQKQAAAAGKLKIAMGKRLKEIWHRRASMEEKAEAVSAKGGITDGRSHLSTGKNAGELQGMSLWEGY